MRRRSPTLNGMMPRSWAFRSTAFPSHVAFAKSLGGITNYPLLADFHPKGEVSKKYGVWKEDKGICERAIVVVDKQGIVRYIDVHDIAEAPENAQILEVLRDLQ